MLPDQLSVERAGAKRDVEFTLHYRLEKLGRFFDRRGEIRVGKKRHWPRRRQQSSTNRVAFTMIRRTPDKLMLDRSGAFQDFARDIAGCIDRAIIDHDQLTLR